MKRWMIALVAATGAAMPVLAEDAAVMDKGTAPDLPPGIVAKELNDKVDIRGVLASAVEAALTKGGFDDLCERLTTLDRERIGDFPEQEFSDLDGRIQQITDAYRAKYGEDFDLKDEDMAGLVVIREGEVNDPALIRDGWPLRTGHDMDMKKVTDDMSKDMAKKDPAGMDAARREVAGAADAAGDAAADAADKDGVVADAADDAADAVKDAADDMGDAARDVTRDDTVAADDTMTDRQNEYLDKGRNVAIGYIPAGHGMPALTLSMYREAVDDWRIDIPDKLSGEQIKAHLLTALTHLGENVDNWPADVATAKQKIAHKVLLSLHGVEYDMKGETAGVDLDE